MVSCYPVHINIVLPQALCTSLAELDGLAARRKILAAQMLVVQPQASGYHGVQSLIAPTLAYTRQ